MTHTGRMRNPVRAYVRGRITTIDRQHSWHSVRGQIVPVVTEALARARARDIARRTGRDDLDNLLALVGQPLEVLFR